MLTANNVILTRRGHRISGKLVLSKYHTVFQFTQDRPREIWICHPIIERISKSRGCSWLACPNGSHEIAASDFKEPVVEGFDKFAASNIRMSCKDFTYYTFDFHSDSLCSEVYQTLSKLALAPKLKGSTDDFYALEYKPNFMEAKLDKQGWAIYDAEAEYVRQGLIEMSNEESVWRTTKLNANYRLCPTYPEILIVPKSISDSVVQHAAKFRSKQRIPAVVYKHRLGTNGNVIARCLQPLVGLNLQNRSIQDEKLIEEIFKSQDIERARALSPESELHNQPQKNLLVDLRPLTNALAQHALGAGTENVDNYRGKGSPERENAHSLASKRNGYQYVDKIFCNIDNIHVMRDLLGKLSLTLGVLDKPQASRDETTDMLQQALTKTQWLHRLSIILQAVDRISKSIHLNNTNVLIHCSDGWDRTSQVSALSQLCLDPYFRTLKGFMVLVEKEWLSFGFKFATRADHGGCIGAILPREPRASTQDSSSADSEPAAASLLTSQESSTLSSIYNSLTGGSAKTMVTSFLQKAASHIKSTAAAATSSTSLETSAGDAQNHKLYGGSSESSPIFHQFLDCVYQIYRQAPNKFEFNSRFLKRLFYHCYSCQYGTFLCNSEKSFKVDEDLKSRSVSVWDYFLSRPQEFLNPEYDEAANNDAIVFNYSEVKWWYELYGRTDEEMNGLLNSLDRKFAQLKLQRASEAKPQSDASIAENATATPPASSESV